MLPRNVAFGMDGKAVAQGCAANLYDGEACYTTKVLWLPGDNPEFIDYNVVGKTYEQIVTEVEQMAPERIGQVRELHVYRECLARILVFLTDHGIPFHVVNYDMMVRLVLTHGIDPNRFVQLSEMNSLIGTPMKRPSPDGLVHRGMGSDLMALCGAMFGTSGHDQVRLSYVDGQVTCVACLRKRIDELTPNREGQ